MRKTSIRRVSLTYRVSNTAVFLLAYSNQSLCSLWLVSCMAQGTHGELDARKYRVCLEELS